MFLQFLLLTWNAILFWLILYYIIITWWRIRINYVPCPKPSSGRRRRRPEWRYYLLFVLLLCVFCITLRYYYYYHYIYYPLLLLKASIILPLLLHTPSIVDLLHYWPLFLFLQTTPTMTAPCVCVLLTLTHLSISSWRTTQRLFYPARFPAFARTPTFSALLPVVWWRWWVAVPVCLCVCVCWLCVCVAWHMLYYALFSFLPLYALCWWATYMACYMLLICWCVWWCVHTRWCSFQFWVVFCSFCWLYLFISYTDLPLNHAMPGSFLYTYSLLFYCSPNGWVPPTLAGWRGLAVRENNLVYT